MQPSPPTKPPTLIDEAFNQLRTTVKIPWESLPHEAQSIERIIYNAGLPQFPRVFSRDGIIAALLAQSKRMLRDQLDFCLVTQGKESNPHTGEEFGKVVHEFPGFSMRGLSTEYNACDTTALYIIGLHELLIKTPFTKQDEEELQETREEILNRHERGIKKAISYVQSHVDSRGLFCEDPKLAGADKFALKVTYWKDSEVVGRVGGEPKYPVVYTLAHVQNLAAIRKAAELLPDYKKLLSGTAEKMLRGMSSELIITETISNGTETKEKKVLALGLDAIGKWKPPEIISPDSLHALYYLEEGDLPGDLIESIGNDTTPLQTSIGYISALIPTSSGFAMQAYHGSSVWPFENAMIHAGAKKFGLQNSMEISSRVQKVIQTDFFEYFTISVASPSGQEQTQIRNNDGGVTKAGDTPKAAGCHPQLWTITAQLYFQRELGANE
eukprot:TRINITY_DN3450_c0_g1_i1.p1 TRINITY_DN3450_c0_g1~~TRINITY_DN3450_c0_g1_i1.p1  ORF type:complete len:440 (-),score=102.18 TRINITY_DN3450_c0_g1_i1:15-1334(-)